MQARLSRAESPEGLLWDLSAVYTTRDEWEADVCLVEDAIPSVTAYHGRIAEGASVCLACLRERDRVQARLDKVSCYATLLMLADATSAEHQTLAGRAGMVVARVAAALDFIQGEIAALPDATITSYLQEIPELEPYRRQIEHIRTQHNHLLSEEAEATLSALGDTLDAPWALYQQISSVDVSFTPARDALGNEVPVRREASFCTSSSPRIVSYASGPGSRSPPE